MRRFGIFFGTAVILSAAAAAWGATGAPEVVARISTGSQPCSEVGGLGYVWVGVGGTGQLARIDPATNAVTARVPVGPGPCGVAIGAGSVWVDGYGTSSVIRVDPGKLKVVKRIPLHDQVWDVAFGAGSVWATEPGLGYVARISPKTNRVRHRFRIPGTASPANLRTGAGAVWVGALSGRRIFRIDAAHRPREHDPRGRDAALARRHADRGLGLELRRGHRLPRQPAHAQGRRHDPRGRRSPENPAVADDGTVFVPCGATNTLVRIDPATNTVIGRIHVGTKPFPAASAFGDIWVPSYGGDDVYRVHVG